MPVLDYQTQEKQVGDVSLIFSVSACVVGLVGNLSGVLAVLVTLVHLPVGTTIWTQALATKLFFIAAGTAIAGLPLGVIGVIGGRHRRTSWLIGALGILLSLMPGFTSRWAFVWIITGHGLVVLP